MNTSARLALNHAEDVNGALGVTPPKAFTAGVVEIFDLHRRTSTALADMPHTPIGAALEATRNGRDLATDPDFLGACALAYLQNGFDSNHALAEWQEGRKFDLLIEHYPALVELWRAKLAKHTETLVEAAEAFGHNPDALDNAGRIMGSKESTVSIWARAGQARAAWNSAKRAIGLINMALPHLPQVQGKMSALIYTGDVRPDTEKLDGLDPWKAICNGYAVDLATPEILSQRVATWHEQRREIRRAAEKRRQHAIARTAGLYYDDDH